MRRLLVLGVFLTGCATPVESEPRVEADAATTTSAFVVTTQTVGRAERMAARAAFVRVVDAHALSAVTKTLGLEPDLPVEGRCGENDGPTEAPSHAELVDAGEVWIGDEAGETRLVARAFPDLLSVSGLVYTTPSDELGRAGEDTWVRIKGGSDVDARTVRLGLAMPELHARRVDDALTFDEPRPGDRTWVELSDAVGHRRCTLAAGATSFVVDAPADATITIHRDRRRTEGSLTVRAETVEIIGRAGAPSGS